MPFFAFILVILSTFIHATWNALGKESHDGRLFFTWMCLWASIAGFPLLIISTFFIPLPIRGLIWPLVSGIFVGVYFLTLDMGYRSGDLSMVYPVARSAPLFVPLWAMLFIGEIISFLGGLGIAFTLLGVYIIPMKQGTRHLKSFFKSPAVIFALLTALFSSGYSVIDKAGIRAVHPYQYVYIQYCAGGVVMVLFYLVRGEGRAVFTPGHSLLCKAFWAGMGSILAYGINLFALQWSKVSYVTAVRQFCIIPGMFLGVVLFKERLGAYRIAGAAGILIGTILLGFAE